MRKNVLVKNLVRSMEQYNFRYAEPTDFTEGLPSFASIDVSFISLNLILPALAKVLVDGGQVVALVKPQFEAGREAIGRGGLVRREADRLSAILKVLTCAAQHNLHCAGLIRSTIDGGDGNHEYLAHFRKSTEPCILPDSAAVRRWLHGTTL